MKKFFVLASAVFVLSGCATYENNSVDKFKAKGETHEEAYVDYYLSLRSHLSEEVEIDGKKVFVPKYSLLKLVDLERKLEESLDVINQITDYKNQEASNFVDENNLRDELLNDKKRLEAQLQRVKLARLHEMFRNLTGTSFHGTANENGKYDAKKIFWPKDLAQAFPFVFDKIDDAKDRKVLREIERESWSSKRMLDVKEPDPTKLDDSNAFIWKSKDESLEFVSFKILDADKPENNQSDYIEAFRVIDGKKEKKPALKIFFPQGNSNGVMVLDTDRENEIGFGIPDVVESVFVSKIADIWSNGSIVPRLFKEKETRVVPKKPEPKPIKIEIARVGSPIDAWEISKDPKGWVVPFKYKNDIGSNFNVGIKLKDKKSETEIFVLIEHFKKEWTGSNQFTASVGSVAEFYKPKNPYDGELLKAETRSNEGPKTLYFVFSDGRVEQGVMPANKNRFIEDEPYAVEYTEGQKRWRIEKDKDSNIFNKKKEVAIK